jgi:hypothetical protein
MIVTKTHTVTSTTNVYFTYLHQQRLTVENNDQKSFKRYIKQMSKTYSLSENKFLVTFE